MSASLWYSVELTCCSCDSVVPVEDVEVYTYGLSPEIGNIGIEVGDLLDVPTIDLEDAFPPTRPWLVGRPLYLLEHWSCPVCGTGEAVELSFVEEGEAGWRLVEATARCLDDEVLRRVDGVSVDLRQTLTPEQAALLDLH